MSSPHESIWIGFDRRQVAAFVVAHYSIQRFNRTIPIGGLVLDKLIANGLYRRPLESRVGDLGQEQMWDVISDAPMSTEFANSRFLVPHLAQYGWALFVDCDILCYENISNLFALADNSKAIMCVKHDHRPTDKFKMDGQMQTVYSRKNWSSVVLFNCEHPSNRKLTLEMINGLPGRDLHRFCWLEDDEIGELPRRWNYLVGYDSRQSVPDPAIVHFTNGLPDVPGSELQEFASDWHKIVPVAVRAL